MRFILDEATKNTIDNFVTYLSNELPKVKHFQKIQMGKWSLKNFEVSIKFYLNDKTGELIFDLREIKDNPYRYGHLLSNAMDQLRSNKITF